MEEMTKVAVAWHEASAALEKARAAVDPLKISRPEAGIFQIPYTAYIDAATFIQERVKEGATQAEAISTTLKNNVAVYRREEENNTHAITGLY